MRVSWFSLTFLFPLVLFSSCSLISIFGEQEEFITIRDMQFFHRGKPHYFAGTNLWYGAYLGSPGSTGDRPRLERELDALKSLGVTNLRVLAASESSPLRRSVKPAIQHSPGTFDDSLLIGLDVLLAEMAERDMHAVLYLGNYWEWSGGFTQYNVWTGGPLIDPEATGHTWSDYMDYAAAFYSNPEAQKIYRNFIRSLLQRRNTVNGMMYSLDPTIMAWQLANEPRPGTVEAGEKNLPAFYKWIDETAAFIDSLDGNHLISTGSEGSAGSLLSEEFFLAAHDSKHIDYLTFHVWAFNWKWFDPEKPEETLILSQANAKQYIDRHIAAARVLKKPAVMDEFGLVRDLKSILPGTPTTARDQYYRFVYRVVEDSARAGAPVAGSNFWAWGGEESARHEDGMWRVGDPFVGDPPQEPQGLNSVFLSDSSTLSIISRHAQAMRSLGKGIAVASRAQ